MNSEESVRAFLAIEFTDQARGVLARLRSQLEPVVPSARWVRSDQLHLTLAFLGDAPTHCLEELAQRLNKLTRQLETFTLQLESVGAFPNPRQPRVLWAGLAGPELDQLNELQHLIANAASASQCPPADNRFSPHVTLARLKPGRAGKRPPDLTSVLASFTTWTGGEVLISEVTLFESVLNREGPCYKALNRAALRAKMPPL